MPNKSNHPTGEGIRGPYKNRPTTHGTGEFAAQKVRWIEQRAERERLAKSVTIESCWICQTAVLCSKGRWYDDIGKEHSHQPGSIRRLAEKEAAASSGYGKARVKVAAEEEPEED